MAIYAIKKQNDGKILIGGSSFAATSQSISTDNIARLNSNGSLDVNFETGGGFTNASIFTIATQNDGKILVGGSFTSYSGSSVNNIVRLNPSGSIDETFNIGDGFNDGVRSIAIQDDGKILVGGQFSSYSGSYSLNKFIRLNTDGTIDETATLGQFNSDVLDIAIQPDGKILVGGSFTSYGGSSSSRLVRLNTDLTKDTTFLSGSGINGFNNTVFTIAIQDDGKILVGGNFTFFDQVDSGGIARISSIPSKTQLVDLLFDGEDMIAKHTVQPFVPILPVASAAVPA
jgi:uncharacterized delta-60 repeat protein